MLVRTSQEVAASTSNLDTTLSVNPLERNHKLSMREQALLRALLTKLTHNSVVFLQYAWCDVEDGVVVRGNERLGKCH